jgi:hypothetical protein
MRLSTPQTLQCWRFVCKTRMLCCLLLLTLCVGCRGATRASDRVARFGNVWRRAGRRSDGALSLRRYYAIGGTARQRTHQSMAVYSSVLAHRSSLSLDATLHMLGCCQASVAVVSTESCSNQCRQRSLHARGSVEAICRYIIDMSISQYRWLLLSIHCRLQRNASHHCWRHWPVLLAPVSPSHSILF